MTPEERGEKVYDLFNQRPLAHDAAQFYDKLAPGSTMLYYTGSREKLAH